MDEEFLDIIKYTKESAKQALQAEDFSRAKLICEKLWEESDKNDPYILYLYGKALRKTGESIKFLDISRSLYKNNKIMSNTYIISTICWCLYDCNIKPYEASDTEQFEEFLKSAEYIRTNCQQKDASEYHINPYVLTIVKVVKIYNKRASKNYKEVIRWLNYLDHQMLSEKEFSFCDESGKDRELASIKEFYYQNLIKALEKTEQYQECINKCEIALEQIKKFHYRNKTWIKARMFFSRCMVSENVEIAINEYKKMADNENYWFMYHKLSQICFRYNKMTDSLLYACKAFVCRFEEEKMVNLMLDIALTWQANGDQDNAKKFLHASAYYRKRQHWGMPEELRYMIQEFQIDIDEEPNIRELQDICNKYITVIEGEQQKFEGRIINIIKPHCKAGFIKPNSGGENIYFNVKEIKGNKTSIENALVEYCIGNDDKGRSIAIKINIRG